jgi:hypothetical protein
MHITRQPTIENVDLDDDAEVDAFDDQIIAAGLERVRAEGDELRRRGILDAEGSVLPLDYAASRSASSLFTFATLTPLATPRKRRSWIWIQEKSNSYQANPWRAEVGCAW